MKNTKFSIKKLKDLPSDPKVIHAKGTLLEKMGKLDSAIDTYKIAASDNYVKSQYRLGIISIDKKNYKEAEEWLSLAWKNGSEDAAFELGNMYYKLKGYEYCLYWYEKIASQGNIQAQNNLGVTHFMMKDYDRAEKWLKSF